MRSYEEISERIMQRGDEIIESRRNRAERIKHISFFISGVCAALIVGIGIHHSSDLKKAYPPFRNNNLIIVPDTTESNSSQSTVTTVTTSPDNRKTTTLTVSDISAADVSTITSASASESTSASTENNTAEIETTCLTMEIFTTTETVLSQASPVVTSTTVISYLTSTMPVTITEIITSATIISGDITAIQPTTKTESIDLSDELSKSKIVIMTKGPVKKADKNNKRKLEVFNVLSINESDSKKEQNEQFGDNFNIFQYQFGYNTIPKESIGHKIGSTRIDINGKKVNAELYEIVNTDPYETIAVKTSTCPIYFKFEAK